MTSASTTLFLCGDVMTGRGIDQILPCPSDPALYEGWVRSAVDYVALAEQATGPIARPVAPAYVWGDALEEMRRADARIVNLETAVTTNDTPFPKGINYRMHPGNVGCLTAAHIDCCVLANNHVLDWEVDGLRDTLDTLHRVGLRTAGAGRDRDEAERPAVIDLADGGRVLVYGFGHPSSGVPSSWAAGPGTPGITVVDLTDRTVAAIADRIRRDRRPGDLVVASIHWGGNWGYEIPAAHRTFARALVDRADVDVVHGHSSHHPVGLELRRGKPILYGCGDYLNDYEGIAGYETFRPELTLGYLPTFDRRTRALERFELVPLRIRHFQVQRATADEAAWLARTLDRESARLGAAVTLGADGRLHVTDRAGAPA